MSSASFKAAMALLQNAKPLSKLEFIAPAGTVTDISKYYLSGANFEQVKDRGPDQQLQAGAVDFVIDNHDNYFSEFVSTSLFYNLKYHAGKLRYSHGFQFADGTTEYEVMFVGLIDTLTHDPRESQCTISCRDAVSRIVDAVIHATPAAETAVAGATNSGNGTFSKVSTMPFVMVNENWTITCTLGGGSGVATFSVVGSVSGNIGTATCGVQFSNGTTGGIKFTISSGSNSWVIGDVFTFSTKQHPQWASMNPAKIIWSVLTGYDWDTNTQNVFSGFLLGLDHTQSTANVDINYTSFVNAISDLVGQSLSTIDGYAFYDESLVSFLQELLFLFLGCLYTDGNGKIYIQTFVPRYSAASPPNFADTLQIKELSPVRDKSEIYNVVSLQYKATKTWEFSDTSVIYNGAYSSVDVTSLSDYGAVYQYSRSIRWWKSNPDHVSNVVQKLLGRYAQPPNNIEFKTGMDGIETSLGQIITITDSKYNFSKVPCEVIRAVKNFDDDPRSVTIRARHDPDISMNWGFMGSSANEGDGLSPQAALYDNASATDVTFAYMSQAGSAVAPNYRMF